MTEDNCSEKQRKTGGQNVILNMLCLVITGEVIEHKLRLLSFLRMVTGIKQEISDQIQSAESEYSVF